MKSQKLIFIVDDDQTIRYSLERYFSKLECEVKSMSSAFEALLLCMYLVPDLIIADVRMPKLDGLSLIKALRSNEATKNVSLVFMTAYPDDTIMERAKGLGAKYFLLKPFPLEYLDDLLHRCFPHLIQEESQIPPLNKAMAG